MPLRRYSIGEQDQQAGFGQEQTRLQYTNNAQPYRDSPTRNIISPPPGYASPDPPDSPGPASPTQAFLPRAHGHSQPRDMDQEHRYQDDMAPLPPPHRTIPADSSRNPTARKPIGALVGGVHQQQERGRSNNVPQDLRYQDDQIEGATSMHFPPTQPARSRNSSPYLYAQRPSSRLPDRNSYSSNLPLAAGAATPASVSPARTPDARSSRMSGRSIPLTDYSSPPHHSTGGYYSGGPYHNSSHDFDPTVSDASINPQNIADDGDDGFIPDPKRRSALMLGGRSKSRAGMNTPTGAVGMAGGLSTANKQNASASLGQADGENGDEKTWLAKQGPKNRRKRIWLGVGIVVVIVCAIGGAIVGGILGTRQSRENDSERGNINNADDDYSHNGDLDINSPEIKKLMNNKNLHKVFPGMDYTPWGVQYPLCNTYPPSQNNVTRDVAVLSQLTDTIRLYGTDCNQTEMVLHAMSRLKLTNMKLWLGVWIDQNQTTTDRQISHMYKLLEAIKDHSILKGVIIGNEALFRAGETKAEAHQEIVTLLENTRQNFTSLGYDLALGTSDLGDNWDTTLAQASDFVMSNIHPFFAGVQAEQAAAWTWNFWQQKDAPLTANLPDVKQIISETGWPTGGGKDCGGTDGSCAAGQPGAIASIDNLNMFMNDWVCQALANGTQYFWFEAFDEPWKVQFNTPGREWEDKWGLMDAARNLKPGVKIPDCDGKTV